MQNPHEVEHEQEDQQEADTRRCIGAIWIRSAGGVAVAEPSENENEKDDDE